VAIRDPEPLELTADVAASWSGEENVELRYVTVCARERGDEYIGALDELGLETLAPSDPILLERADDEGRGWKVECGSRSGATRPIDHWKMLDVDADRNDVHRARLDAR